MGKPIRVRASFSSETNKKLESEALRCGTTKAALVAQIVTNHLDRTASDSQVSEELASLQELVTAQGNEQADTLADILSGVREAASERAQLRALLYANLAMQCWLGKQLLGAQYEDDAAFDFYRLVGEMSSPELYNMAVHMGETMEAKGGDMASGMASIVGLRGVEVSRMGYTDEGWRETCLSQEALFSSKDDDRKEAYHYDTPDDEGER